MKLRELSLQTRAASRPRGSLPGVGGVATALGLGVQSGRWKGRIGVGICPALKACQLRGAGFRNVLLSLCGATSTHLLPTRFLTLPAWCLPGGRVSTLWLCPLVCLLDQASYLVASSLVSLDSWLFLEHTFKKKIYPHLRAFSCCF